MINDLNLITIQEAMNLLQVSRSTIDRWKKSKQLPFIKIGKEIFFHKEDLECWLRSHTKIKDMNTTDHAYEADKIETITIGYQSQTAHMWSSLIMKELCLFEEELSLINPLRKVRVNWVNAANGLELVEGMIAKKVHIASLGDYPIIISHHLSRLLPNFRPILLGFDGKTSQSEGISLVLPRGTDFKDLMDVSGNKITTVMNSSAGYRLNQLLPQIGMGKYEIVDQEMSVSFSNIIRHNVGASVMWEPYISLSQSKGATKINVEGFSDDYLTGLVAQEEWAQINEDVIIAYLKAHIRTHLFCREYPLKVSKIINKATGISHDIALNIISKVRWDAAVYSQDLQTLQNFTLDNHSFIPSNQDNTVIQYRGHYLDEACKRLNLARLFERPLQGEWSSELLY